jgi:hypothetical protein
MKITIGFGAMSEKAFWCSGLPKIAPMQEAFVEDIKAKMRDAFGSVDPMQIWRQRMPAAGAVFSSAGTDIPGGMHGLCRFWEQVMRTAMTGGELNDK